ncbi:MAG: hypothetical protein ABJF10_18330 [Chthoniobacter sp.]|uniref:hypothetical protein n=1 Tax=Chthoniobacter sp. TaxID=2510640 RepID=UPI0032A5045F
MIAVATPVPVTPPPSTPEPVVVIATPTPAPVVVVATPTPAPTPPPLELAAVVRTPALWPPQVTLVQAVTFPIVLNGRVAGEAKIPVGTALRLLRVGNQSVEVEYQNARQVVPVASTDLMQRALVTFRNNGSVLPQAPVASSAPAPVAPQVASTPAPNPADQVRVEVSAERKRVEYNPGKAVGEGAESKTADKFLYELKVQNRSFGDVPALDVQYLIFVERQKLGTSKDKDTVDRITGSAKFEPLTRKTMIQTAKTSEFQLAKQVLVGDTYYINGGRRKVEDNVLGIWVKVINEGKVIAEYTNPSTVTKRGWDKK